jgi:hypothetical protein
VGHSLASVRRRANDRCSFRNDNDVRLEIEAELQGAARNDPAIQGNEADAGAGLCLRNENQRRRENGNGKFADHDFLLE